jgi:hypothetical protein
MLKEELVVSVERSIGGTTHQGEGPSGLKRPDEVSEAAREDRPDESGKRSVTPSKAPLIQEESIDHLSHR